MTVPYAGATTGAKARDEIVRMLRGFGCEGVGFYDEFSTHSLVLEFTWRGRNVSLRASAQGWANAYLAENPWNSQRRGSRADYEARWLRQGMVAVNSILRDWVKGQVTAIETGILTFDAVFAPHMMLPDGTPAMVALRRTLSLPAPDEEAFDD